MNLKRANGLYLYVTGVTLVIGLIVTLFIDKLDSHLFINRHHSAFFDLFFSYLTRSVELIGIIVLLILTLLKSYRLTLTYGAALIITAVTVQFLKRVVFSNVKRPFHHFQELIELHTVDGVHMLSSYSFPSGHSAAALCMYFILALIWDNPVWKVFCAILALLTAASRVYLSQHFLIDIAVGGCVGLLIVSLVYRYMNGVSHTRLDESIL